MADEQDQAMPDQVQEPVTPQTEQPEVVAETPNYEELLQGTKAEIAGLNRKNSELFQQLEEIKKESMDEKERYKYELEQREISIAEKEREHTKMVNREKAVKFASENDMPLSLLDTMDFNKWESVETNLNTMKTVVNGEREKIIQRFKTESGYSPDAGGGNPPGMLSQAAIATMSPEEITTALHDGRLPGFGRL